MFLAVLDDFFAGQGLALLDGDEGFGAFAPVGVRDGDDTALEDVWMGDDERFHGERGDVFAT